MAITYNWNCKTVDVQLQEDNHKDVVYNVHWIVTGVSEEINPLTNKNYQANNIGTQVVPLDPETQFIPFEDLTNDVVVGWTQTAMGVEEVTRIETNISNQINLLINPVTATMQIPDATPEPPAEEEE